MRTMPGCGVLRLRAGADLNAEWKIVDYKTDAISASQMPAAATHYQAQLHFYSKQWQALLKEPVRECGLYFTHLDQYVVV